jgi:hypothetical protein
MSCVVRACAGLAATRCAGTRSLQPKNRLRLGDSRKLVFGGVEQDGHAAWCVVTSLWQNVTGLCYRVDSRGVAGLGRGKNGRGKKKEGRETDAIELM